MPPLLLLLQDISLTFGVTPLLSGATLAVAAGDRICLVGRNGSGKSTLLGYHLCYGSPADEHLVQPKDMAIMAEMASAICAGVGRSIQYFHMPVPKDRTDDAYFAPLENLRLHPETELYLGLVHHEDAQGDAARLTAARRYARVDGVATECGMARGDPTRLPALLAAHVRAAEIAA